MPTRRQAHCARRRGSHSQMRQGIVPQQGQSASEGPDDSPKAAKATRAQKARRA